MSITTAASTRTESPSRGRFRGRRFSSLRPRSSGAQAARRGLILVALVPTILVAALGVVPSINTSGQEATPTAPGDHPLVGTWIVDPEVDDPTNPPSFDVYMADGTAINVGSEGATAGAWEATGSRTAMLTYAGLLRGAEPATAFILRANIEIDETGEGYTASHSFTVVAPDGTILAAIEGGTARGTRFQAEPIEMGGQSLPGFPTWTPASPEAGTPTS